MQGLEDNYSIKVSSLSAPDGSLVTGNFNGRKYKKAVYMNSVRHRPGFRLPAYRNGTRKYDLPRSSRNHRP